MEEITQEQIVGLDPSEPCIIYIYSGGCSACKAFGPELEKLVSVSPDIRFYKMNVVSNLDYFGKIDVDRLPFFAIQNGPRFAGGDFGASVETVQKIIGAIRHLRDFRRGPA